MKHLLTLFLINTLLVCSSAAFGNRAIDSAALRNLSSAIENEFNKNNKATILINSRFSFELKFDSLRSFISADYSNKNAIILYKFLKEYDERVGILSQNVLFKDTSVTYHLTAFMDKELQRVWFTDITLKDKDKVGSTTIIEVDVPAQYPGGMQRFFEKVRDEIRYSFIKQHSLSGDSLLLSFLIDEKGRTFNVKVNGVENIAMENFISRLGRWNPGMLSGRRDITYCKVQFNMKQLKKKNSEPLYSMGRILVNVPYTKYLRLQFDYNRKYIPNKDLIIVSYVYDGGSNIMGPVVINGSKKEGEHVLEIINKYIENSNFGKMYSPYRHYVIVEDGNGFPQEL